MATPMLYPELFKQLESVRWDMEKDIPWDKFDASTLSDEQAQTIRMNAITEWSALPATEMFCATTNTILISPPSCRFGFLKSKSTRWC